MNRGDIVIVAGRGSFSTKPRPAVIVQADFLNETHPTVLLAPITSELRDLDLFRIAVDPTPANGLLEPSEIMADKLMVIRREQIHRTIGKLEVGSLSQLDRALYIVLGLA